MSLAHAIDDEYGAWPRCPNDGGLLREIVGGWQCGVCTYSESVEPSIIHPGYGDELLEFRRPN